jgi:TolB-like protein/class 3 adenylate cyclase/Flp pilus assembly protein TadD
MSADTEQRRLAAIMFTDMVGYGALSQRDDKLALELLDEHRQLLREIFPRFNGIETKTIGDAFLIEFNSALEAAQCAIEIQRALTKRNADIPPDRRIEVRIGIHIGDVVHRGGDVYGDGVNIASRIEPVAGPGGICVSMDVERQIRNALEARIEKLAPTDLKNIAVPMDLFRIILPWERDSRLTANRGERDVRPRRLRIGWVVVSVILLVVIGIGVFLFQRQKTKVAPRQNASPARTQAATTSTIPEKSIAVLPFENLSSDKDNAYFASGIQDMILTKLAGIKDLKVISRNSTEKYASRPENLKAIAQELGVAKILEGSVQKAGNSVLINVQMIDAGTDAHVWAQDYTRTLDNIFGVEGEVAQKIAESLHAILTGNERSALARKPTENAAALEAYLKGLSLRASFARSPEAPIAAFEQAVALDPGFTLAWTALASAHLDLFWFGYDASPKRLAEAKAALEKAEALAPDLPEVEMTRAEYLYHGLFDFGGALAVIREVQPKLPNNADVWLFTAALERRLGQFDAALQHFAQARNLDPNSGQVAAELDVTLVYMGRTEQARRTLGEDLIRYPQSRLLNELTLILAWDSEGLDAADRFLASLKGENAETHALRAWQALYRRDFSGARKLFSQVVAAEPNLHSQFVFDSYIPAKVGWLLRQALSEARSGLSDEAKNSYGQVIDMARVGLAAKSANRNVEAAWRAALGMAYAGLGQKEQAVAEGKAATALVPATVDHFEGPDFESFLAQIYAMNGDAGQAVALLDRSRAIAASAATPGMLRFDPIWDPIRNDPRFQALLAKLPAEQKQTTHR